MTIIKMDILVQSISLIIKQHNDQRMLNNYLKKLQAWKSYEHWKCLLFHHPLFVSAISVKYLYPVFIKDGMSHGNALVKRCGSSEYEIQLMCGHRCALVGCFTKAVNTAPHRSWAINCSLSFPIMNEPGDTLRPTVSCHHHHLFALWCKM